MFDILSATLYDELINLRGKETFASPCSAAETQVLAHLKTLDSATADTLKPYIYALVQEQVSQAFLSGTRFGTQLMLQLMESY